MKSLVVLAFAFLIANVQPPAVSPQLDVDRLVRAAEALLDSWPSQAPPPVPEVALVARHGNAATPLLIALLSDDPAVERDRKRWRVQQQASLALSRIYSESPHCGRVYCDGDPAERIALIKTRWVEKIADDVELRSLSSRDLLDRFTQEKVFWRQFEIGRALIAGADPATIRRLEPWLTIEDRHTRGNVAFVIAGLGDQRGFETIAAILGDRSPRPQGQGMAVGKWALAAQIRADRYYAAHLLGDLKDPRGVELLIPLMTDKELEHIVPWSLAQIGDRRAIAPLIRLLDRDEPWRRVSAISALEQLNASEALPRLRQLLQDDRRTNFGDPVTVAQAARHAIAMIAGR